MNPRTPTDSPHPRIASLLAGATEILHAIGLGDHVVAISHECDYPLEALDRPRVTHSKIEPSNDSRAIDDQVRHMSRSGEALYGIDGDMLAALAPDVIVTQSHCEVCAVHYEDVASLVRDRRELAHTRIVSMNPMRFDDLFGDIRRIAEACGADEAGRRLIDSLQTRLDAVRRRFHSTDRQAPTVAAIEWMEPLMVAANWLPELIGHAGGRCTMTEAGRPSRYSEWSDLVAHDPEVMVVAPCGFDIARTMREIVTLTSRPEWSRLSAVKSRRIFVVDGNAYFNRAGPRLVDSVELLAELIHADETPAGAAAVRLT